MIDPKELMTFDRESYARLRGAYERAVSAGLPTFKFGNRLLLTGYAKHLIAYLEQEFGKQ